VLLVVGRRVCWVCLGWTGHVREMLMGVVVAGVWSRVVEGAKYRVYTGRREV
jgi:hypothetical protein